MYLNFYDDNDGPKVFLLHMRYDSILRYSGDNQNYHQIYIEELDNIVVLYIYD